MEISRAIFYMYVQLYRQNNQRVGSARIAYLVSVRRVVLIISSNIGCIHHRSHVTAAVAETFYCA